MINSSSLTSPYAIITVSYDSPSFEVGESNAIVLQAQFCNKSNNVIFKNNHMQ
jgi:hypothetical protein